MKIGLIGSHSVGKTELLRALRQRINLPVIPEQSRLVAQEWGYTPATIPEQKVVLYQKEIIRRQVVSEHLLDGTGFLSDRSVVDNLAYWIKVAERFNLPAPMNVFHYTMARKRLPHYDMLVLVPPMFSLVDDGERHTDPIFRIRIYETVRLLVQALELEHKTYVITQDGPQARADEVMEVIRKTDLLKTFPSSQYSLYKRGQECPWIRGVEYKD